MPVDAITTAFRDWGRDRGFRRKGTTLYRDQRDTIAVVNLQGSQYGGRYYVNVALWLTAVGEEPEPRENHCHIRTRLESLAEDPELELALNMASACSDPQRADTLRKSLDAHAGPLLALGSDLAALKARSDEWTGRWLLGREALAAFDAV